MKKAALPAPAPDLEKVRAAIAAREIRLTAKALAIVAASEAAPVRPPRRVSFSRLPEDAARRGIFAALLDFSVARSNFLNLPLNSRS